MDEGRSQAGPKGRSLEVGARRAPRLLVGYVYYIITLVGSFVNIANPKLLTTIIGE